MTQSNPIKLLSYFVCTCIGLISFSLQANHLSGTSISYVQTSPGNYDVSLVVLQDCNDNTVVPSQNLRYFSDCPGMSDVSSFQVQLQSSEQILTDSCAVWEQGQQCLAGIGYFKNIYTGTMSLTQPCASYRVFFKLNYRTITDNLDIAGGQQYYVHTIIDNTIENEPSVWLDQNLPQLCTSWDFQYQMQLSNPDGDSLSYSFIAALEPSGAFDYGDLSYNSGFSGEEPIPGITLNNLDGTIALGATSVGWYSINVKVDEYSAGMLKGSTVHDFILKVGACAEIPVEITESNGTLTLQNPPNDYTYQWFLNGQAIDGATDDFYVTNGAPGDFLILVTSEGGCNSESNVISILTGLKENLLRNVQLFPNPLSDISTLNLPMLPEGNWKLIIVNSMGQGLRTIDLEFLPLNIERKGLPSGAYFIILIDENETVKGSLQFSVIADR